MSLKALENTNEMCSWASYNTPKIELIQYGRRIGKKVYYLNHVYEVVTCFIYNSPRNGIIGSLLGKNTSVIEELSLDKLVKLSFIFNFLTRVKLRLQSLFIAGYIVVWQSRFNTKFMTANS